MMSCSSTAGGRGSTRDLPNGRPAHYHPAPFEVRPGHSEAEDDGTGIIVVERRKWQWIHVAHTRLMHVDGPIDLQTQDSVSGREECQGLDQGLLWCLKARLPSANAGKCVHYILPAALHTWVLASVHQWPLLNGCALIGHCGIWSADGKEGDHIPFVCQAPQPKCSTQLHVSAPGCLKLVRKRVTRVISSHTLVARQW